MEITEKINLSLEEKNLLDMHSVLNVLNVITYELVELSENIDDSETLDPVIQEVTNLAGTLKNRDKALQQVEHVEDFINTLMSALAQVRNNCTTEEITTLNHTQENLLSIADVLRVRAREIVARADNPHAWVEHDIEQLQSNFSQVFKALELNSDGKYRIVENLAQYKPGDYLVLLQIDSYKGSSIQMPAVFQDVMRDLIANARKYSPVGGEIIAGLYQGEDELRFVITDTGRGIPEDEVCDAVRFGGRGSNVQDRPTRGGGFGLTKAYYVTMKQHGRMWIEPREPAGTRIEIRIPLSRGDVS
jgi:signal transduction histidine kinase